MVVLAVIGLIIAIAYPAYTDFIERSRRSEATEALQNLATLQEEYYKNNKEYYTGHPNGLGMTATTSSAYYTLAITAGATVADTIQSYALRADVNAQSSQSGDTDCATIQLDSNGNKTPAACW